MTDLRRSRAGSRGLWRAAVVAGPVARPGAGPGTVALAAAAALLGTVGVGGAGGEAAGGAVVNV